MHTIPATHPGHGRLLPGVRALVSAFTLAGVALGFLSSPTASAATLASWDVSGAANYGASPLAPTTSDAGLTVGGLTRGSGVGTSGTAAARGWGGNNWVSTTTAAAVSANQFASFTVTANAGSAVSFSSISKFDYRRSTTGAASGTVQYQVGSGTFTDITTVSYASTSSTGSSVAAIDLSSISALQNVAAGTTVTFRIVNYGGTNATGTWYLFDTSKSTASDFEIQGTVRAGITASQVRVETSADGSGSVLPASSATTGNPLTVYAVTRSATNVFVANAAATWSLTSITGGVAAGDLVPSADNKSATFTPHAAGSAVIHASVAGLTSVDSGIVSVTAVSTPPSGFGSASATTVTPGQSIVLTVTVTPGANPASTGLAVVGDLTSIGGSASQTFSAGANNTFTLATTIPLNQSTGSKAIPLSLTDAQGRTGTALITLNVSGSVTIFHMNDTHARVTPHWWVIPNHKAALEPKFELVGGAAYLGAEVLSLTAANPDSLVIDGGDISEGNPIGDMGGNATMVRFYRLLSQKLKAQAGRSGRGLDAVVVGNHDVRDASYIANLKNQTDFTPISVNVCAVGTTTPYFAPYVIVNVNGTRVGILGYTTQAAEVGASLASTLTVVDCDWNGTGTNIIHLADYVKELRNTQKCDLVVLAAHVGHSAICTDTGSGGDVKALLVDDNTVKLPEIAITGHWHTWAATVWQPEVLNYKTIFAESSSYMHYVGEVKISSTGKYLDSAQHVIRCADIAPDADVNALLDTLKAEYAAANPTKPIDKVVGFTGDNLLLDNYMKWWSGDEYPWTGDNTAGEWICDGMQWKAAKLFGNCDLALEAGGGVRADIPVGPVTYSQVYETFPWADDTYMMIKMTGQEIYNYFKDHNCNAAFSRGWVITVVDGSPTTITYKDQPVDLAKSYDVAINNYMYAHDTSHTWVDQNPRSDATLVRDSLIEYMGQYTETKPYLVGGPRFAINTEFSGGYRAVITMLNDHDTKTSYEDAYIRLLSATPETLARRGGKQVPSDLVNADGSIAPAHSLAEIELYRSYLGFKQGVLQPGDIIETWGKGSFYDGQPEFVDQEGIYADGVEFKIVGHDANLAQPVFMTSISAFWNGPHKNHYVRFLAKKAGTDTVTDQFGQTIKIWDETAYAAKTLPGSTGDLLVITGVTSVANFGLRFSCDNVALASSQGFSGFPVTSSLASHVDPLPPGVTNSTLTLTATASAASSSDFVLTPVADAQVVSAKSTSNYGTGTNLYIQSASAGSYGNERSWLRFDLSTLPAGTSVTGATLELYCFKAAGAALPAAIYGSSTDTWTETGLTWASQPAFSSALATQTLASGTSNVWYKWDVTSFVQTELAGDKLASFVAKAVTENSADTTSPSYAFDAKEYGSNSPVLRITTAGSTATTIAQVQYYYRFSANGSTWGGWTPFATATIMPYPVSFAYPQGYGYYEFYSVATDSNGTVEAAPLAADSSVHYTATPAYSTEAIITLGNLSQTYDGTPHVASATTLPSGLSVTLTYNGSDTAPVNGGLYNVVAIINQPGYTGNIAGILAVAKANQTITFGAIAAKTNADPAFALSGNASSGLSVTYTSSNPAVATVSGSTVTIVGPGTTTITADQNGNDNYYSAAPVSQSLTVTSGTAPGDSSDVPSMPLWAIAALAVALFAVAARLLKPHRQE